MTICPLPIDTMMQHLKHSKSTYFVIQISGLKLHFKHNHINSTYDATEQKMFDML